MTLAQRGAVYDDVHVPDGAGGAPARWEGALRPGPPEGVRGFAERYVMGAAYAPMGDALVGVGVFSPRPGELDTGARERLILVRVAPEAGAYSRP